MKAVKPALFKCSRGCLFWSMFLFFIWIAGGIGLWHAAMNAPASKEDDNSTHFVLFPLGESNDAEQYDEKDGSSDNK